MIKLCVICGYIFKVAYRAEWDYVPHVCSSKCFVSLLKQIPIPHKDMITMAYEAAQDCEAFKNQLPDFRSSYERQFVEWLKSVKIKFDYEPFKFSLPDKSKYVPDFLIPMTMTFLEVKGLWETGAKKKFRLFIETFGFRTFLLDKLFLDMLRRMSK